MILIITHKLDYTADFLINILNGRAISYKRLNCEDINQDICQFTFDSNFDYSILGEHHFTSVWFRRTKLPDLTSIAHHEKVYLLNDYDSLLKNLFTIIDAKWLSDPFAVYKAENKLYQLKIASALGFTIPRTLITNSKTELRDFYNLMQRNIIIKPITHAKISHGSDSSFIYTNKLKEIFIENLSELDLTPCIYQENISKEYEIRVTVVGEDVFAAAVYSQNDKETIQDWRRRRLTFHKVELPDSISGMCVRLVKGMNLFFGAIDLIKNTNGEYIFLEINPNGQWAWIEDQTGMQISDSLINQLT